MVNRAKGVIENMEFIQFHPTSLYNPGERPSFLITEAMRGFGAILKTKDGNTFMEKYHPMGSLAPRDIVARSIDNEMKVRGDDFVYLDARHTDPQKLINHFPNIYQKCLDEGYDITKEPIPVVPSQHYFMGGIDVDSDSKTSMERLFAVGETACNGVHGKNRLASNSLLESLVFAKRAAFDILSGYSCAEAPAVSVEEEKYENYKEEYKKALAKLGLEVNRKIIVLKDVKEVGSYVALVKLHKDVTANVAFDVVAEGASVEAASEEA